MGIIAILGLLFSSLNVMATDSFYTIPEGVLLSNGLSTVFVAKFALFLAVLLFWTIISGQILKALFKCPTIAGQIIGGIFIGPSCFDVLHWNIFKEPLRIFDGATNTIYVLASSDLFLFFIVLISAALTVSYLLWIAGHETEIRDIFHVGITATAAGILGAVMPIVFTLAYDLISGEFNLIQSISLGLIFSATSVSIPVTMLVSQRKMHLKSSKATLGAAIIDDIFSIILLSIFFIALQAGTFGEFTGVLHAAHGVTIGEAIVYMLFSFAFIFFTGYFLIPPALNWLQNHHSSYLLTSFASGAMLLYFAFAEMIGGLAGITGAFFAGLFHRMGDARHQAEESIAPFVRSFLLPIFLGSIGLQVNVSLLSYYQWISVIILLFLAIFSKILACFMSTFFSNISGRRNANRWTLLETYLFGSSMVARGEVGLVISTILRGSQIITADQYVIAVVVIILSTIVSPLMLAVGFFLLEKTSVGEADDYVCNLGLFNTVGTTHMFSIILSSIDAMGVYKTSVSISEGCQIVSLEGHNVKIIFDPEEGIIFRGNRSKIEDIINKVRMSIVEDLDRLPEKPQIEG